MFHNIFPASVHCLIPKPVCIFRCLLQRHSSPRYQILYQHSTATVTNYYFLSGLSSTNVLLYSSPGQKSDMRLTGLTSTNQQACVSLQRSRGTIHYFAFSSIPRGCQHLLVHSSSPSPSKNQQQVVSFFHHISLPSPSVSSL